MPHLRALVESAGGEPILRELKTLVERLQARAPRYSKTMFARLWVDGADAPEVAVVRDISASGVRLQLPSTAMVDVLQARRASIETRMPGGASVKLEAMLIRIAAQRESGADLAFQFTEESQRNPSLHGLLALLMSEKGK